MQEAYTLKIVEDSDPQNPREWDNLGTMCASHKRYSLGDEKQDIINFDDFSSWEEIETFLTENNYVFLPLFLFDHSGITVSTSPFSDRWDSGQVGYIVVSKTKIKQEYGNANQVTIKRVLKILDSEVKIYDQYLTGDVYGFEITDTDDTTVDSCFGFFGRDEAKKAGLEALQDIKEKDQKQKERKLKNLIRSRVPLQYRALSLA